MIASIAICTRKCARQMVEVMIPARLGLCSGCCKQSCATDKRMHVCRYLISQHPEVEKKILAELEELQLLKTAQNPKAREMTYADLSKLTYLNAVIKVLE